MRRPETSAWTRPARIADYPAGPGDWAGQVVEGHAGWRVFRPVVDPEKCVACDRCWLLCPDGAVDRSAGKAAIDYEFCKGCGICAHECPKKAITMLKEGE